MAISELPPELLLLTFSFLDTHSIVRCCYVCRSWRNISREKVLWRARDAELRPNSLLWRGLRAWPITRVVLREGCIAAQDIAMLSLVIKDLQSATLYGDSDEVLAHVARNFPSLQELQLNLPLTSFGASWLASTCSNLKSLHVANTSRTPIFSHLWGWLRLSNLMRLNLPGCPIDDRALHVICHVSARLRFLNIHGSRLVTDAGLIFVTQLASLLQLNVSLCTISDRSLAEVARSCTKLVALKLASCTNVTDDSMRALWACSQLVELNVNNCLAVTGAGLQALPTSLRALSMAGVPGGDCVVQMVCAAHPKLRLLDVGQCGVTDYSMGWILDCKDLRLLRMCHTGITDRGLSHIATSLTTLDLSGCRISDVGVAHVTARCPKLRRLDISHCWGVSKASIDVLKSRLIALS